MRLCLSKKSEETNRTIVTDALKADSILSIHFLIGVGIDFPLRKRAGQIFAVTDSMLAIPYRIVGI